MKETVCMDGLKEIYAAHGKRLPDEGIRNAIFKRIQNLPPEFMSFAIAQLEDAPSLPTNLGYHLLRELWPDYRFQHPEITSVHDKVCCPLCISGYPGWRLVYKPETTAQGVETYEPVQVRCTCGNISNPAFRDWPVYSDRELEQQGYFLKYPGPRMDREQFMAKYGKFLALAEPEKQQDAPEEEAEF